MRKIGAAARIFVSVGIVVGVAAVAGGAGHNQTVADSFWDHMGGQAEAMFSESVASAGDVNGDGYQDLVVGARMYDSGATNSGRAWVFYGGPAGFSDTPDVTLDPPLVTTHGFFGLQVATAGDVNGDGYDDVMAGMMNWDEGSNPDEGAVFVYHGSAVGLDPNHDWLCRTNTTWAHLGWGMDTAGDVNGDGYDDIIVGGWDYATNNFQGAMVFFGSPTGLDANGTRLEGTPTNADWVVDGRNDQAEAGFGIHVGSAGDVNGDGYDEVWVGAPYYNMGEVEEGVLFLWYGSAGGLGPNTTPATADWYVESNQAEARLAGSLENSNAGAIGDVNGDGYDDLIVGAWLYDIDGVNRGIAMVFYGSVGGLGPNGNPTNADWMATGEHDNDYLGCPALGAGDVNGDGLKDVLVGSYGWDDPDTATDNVGAVAVWYGGEGGLPRDGQPHWADVLIQGEQGGAHFARTIAPAGDADNDGQDDLVVGSMWYQDTLTQEGAAFGFYGEPITFMDDFETGDTLRWSTEVD